MLALRSVGIFAVLMTIATNTFAADFPITHPGNQKEAEDKGLQRVNLEELKKFIPGIISSKGFKGGKHLLTFKSDGSVDRTGSQLKNQTGKWHFDEKNNAYCVVFYVKKGFQQKETCFAVYRSSNGAYFFDYDIENGFYAHVWYPGE
jgi:hypothetical protein